MKKGSKIEPLIKQEKNIVIGLLFNQSHFSCLNIRTCFNFIEINATI